MLDKNGKILLWEVFNREEYNHYTHTPIGELLGHIVDNIEQCNRRSFICHEKSCEDESCKCTICVASLTGIDYSIARFNINHDLSETLYIFDNMPNVGEFVTELDQPPRA